MSTIKFIVTGTHAYGPVRLESDLDIVILAKDLPGMYEWLSSNQIQWYKTEAQALYVDSGFYFDMGGIQVNIVVAKDEEEFNLWRVRTDFMKTLKPIEDKVARREMFNSGTFDSVNNSYFTPCQEDSDF